MQAPYEIWQIAQKVCEEKMFKECVRRTTGAFLSYKLTNGELTKLLRRAIATTYYLSKTIKRMTTLMVMFIIQYLSALVL